MSTAFRVLGVDLPPKKPVMVALRKIYGVGDFVSMNICAKLGLNPQTKLAQLEGDMPRIKNYLELNVLAKAQQLRRLSENINFKIKINSWEGMRHQYCLTVNGQKKSNGNTQRRVGEKRARVLNFPLAKPKASKQQRGPGGAEKK